MTETPYTAEETISPANTSIIMLIISIITGTMSSVFGGAVEMIGRGQSGVSWEWILPARTPRGCQQTVTPGLLFRHHTAL